MPNPETGQTSTVSGNDEPFKCPDGPPSHLSINRVLARDSCDHGQQMRPIRLAALALSLPLMAVGCGGGHQSSRASATSGHESTAAGNASTGASTTHGHRSATRRPHGPVGGGEEPSGSSKRAKPLSVGYHLRLTGRGDHRISGRALTALISLRGGSHEACWEFGRLPRISEPSSAFGHLHAAVVPSSASIRAGTSRRAVGPVLVPLGVHYSARGCTPVTASIVNAIASAPADYYVAAQSSHYPGGVLRAQL